MGGSRGAGDSSIWPFFGCSFDSLRGNEINITMALLTKQEEGTKMFLLFLNVNEEINDSHRFSLQTA